MSQPTIWTESQCAQYEFSIELGASPERVWRAITDQVGAWWLPSFRMLGEGSIVELEARAGGRLYEKNGDCELLWYTVISINPVQVLELAGHCSAKYGGPATTLLALELIPQNDNKTLLRISDSIYGRVTEGLVQSLTAGWRELFTDGLKAYLDR